MFEALRNLLPKEINQTLRILGEIRKVSAFVFVIILILISTVLDALVVIELANIKKLSSLSFIFV